MISTGAPGGRHPVSARSRPGFAPGRDRRSVPAIRRTPRPTIPEPQRSPSCPVVPAPRPRHGVRDRTGPVRRSGAHRPLPGWSAGAVPEVCHGALPRSTPCSDEHRSDPRAYGHRRRRHRRSAGHGSRRLGGRRDRLGQARAVREHRQLVDQHGQRLQRRPAVHPEHVARVRRRGPGPPGVAARSRSSWPSGCSPSRAGAPGPPARASWASVAPPRRSSSPPRRRPRRLRRRSPRRRAAARR